MKKNKLPQLLFFLCSCLFTACNTATHEKYFDVAVLSSNMLVGFAGEGLNDQFESPSVKLEGDGQTVPMSRSELLGIKIRFLEEDFKKLQDLKETADTKEMLQASLALYKYILPVYKLEYVQLARSYDDGVSKEKIQYQLKMIHDKYYARHIELFNKLISVGKLFAERHAIKVNWAM